MSAALRVYLLAFFTIACVMQMALGGMGRYQYPVPELPVLPEEMSVPALGLQYMYRVWERADTNGFFKRSIGPGKRTVSAAASDPCAGWENQCGNGACAVTNGVPSCKCDDGYTGYSCTTNVKDPCAGWEGQCGNGACVVSNGVPSCKCQDGYTGYSCLSPVQG